MSGVHRTPPPDPGDARSEFRRVLPAEPHGPHLSWWGTVMALIAVGMLLSGALFAYAFLSAQVRGWPPEGVDRPDLLWPTISTAVLLASLVPATATLMAGRRGRPAVLQSSAFLTALLGIVHLVIQGWTYTDLPMAPTEGAYGSVFVLVVAIHHLILLAGIVGLLMLAVQVWGRPGERLMGGAQGLGLWWQVSTAYWLLVYGTLYLSPLIFGGGGG
jgi:heme/copper-type cytochrome/quinol oxidase subunit 3